MSTTAPDHFFLDKIEKIFGPPDQYTEDVTFKKIELKLPVRERRELVLHTEGAFDLVDFRPLLKSDLEKLATLLQTSNVYMGFSGKGTLKRRRLWYWLWLKEQVSLEFYYNIEIRAYQVVFPRPYT